MTTTSHEPLVWYSHADPHNSAEGFEGPIDVFFRRSLDGGRLWTARRALNDDHANRKRANKYEVGVSVAPNGRLDVAWYDFRLSPATAPTSSQGEAGLQDVFYVSSGDRGKTFSRNLHITDRSIDRSIGVCSNNIDSKFNRHRLSRRSRLFRLAGHPQRQGRAPGRGHLCRLAEARGPGEGLERIDDAVPGWLLVSTGLGLGMGLTALLAWASTRS